jgi:hypothetical protein
MVVVPMPLCEVCDRLTITILKLERLTHEQADHGLLRKQRAHYEAGIDYCDDRLVSLIAKLKLANASIWDAEHDLRKGLEGNMSLAEVGQIAITVRDLNRHRVACKNEIAAHVNQSMFTDVKMNHASQL